MILRSIGKGVKRQGIECRTSWIIGLPDETEGTVNETIGMLLAAKPDVAVICYPIPFPGTRLAKQSRELIVNSDYQFWRLTCSARLW
jgi:radical SAM superfamily enzyme YgiQ (UPF0313 family)